jgi:copper chaperone CopZ
MRLNRSISLFTLAAAVTVLTTGLASACKISSAMMTGKFGANGEFEVIAATTSDGKPLDKLAGKSLTKVTQADGVTLVPANYTDRQIWLVGDVDCGASKLHIGSWTADKEEAMAHVAKVTSGVTKGASAQTAGASGCGSKGASAKTAGASGCGSKGASAKTAGASGCSGKWAAAASSCGSKAASAAGATPKTASSKCGPDCQKECCAGAAPTTTAVAGEGADAILIIYNVSGMTCGGCVGQVKAAVASLGFGNIQSCEVSLEDGRAVIHASGDVCRKSIQKAISEAGFPAELVAQADEEKVETTAEKS